MSAAHYALNVLRPFLDNLALVRINAEISAHYHAQTYFARKYGLAVSLIGCMSAFLLINLIRYLVDGWPFIKLVFSGLSAVPLLVLAISALGDTVLIIRSPYPPDEVFTRHGVPVRFLPMGQTAAKIAVACGHILSTGVKASLALTSLTLLDIEISNITKKDHPFPATQFTQRMALKQLGVEVKQNPTWREIGEGWNKYAYSKDEKS